ncbi:MAG: NADH-quinone oxidoreductase subunit L [Deltaproteobacteria bacterium]|nr:NADH-quinone oxidoreductase subunit L [Deltaproteobacteria bacterium]MBW2398604.1 NADH-quinone oxidoreductase subunit L [Deltaproteobacteria bacterium]
MVTGGTEFDLLHWIPLAPLFAAVLHGVLLVVVRRTVSEWITVAISCGAITASFVISCAAFARMVRLPDESRLLVDHLYTWIGAGVGSQAFSTELAFQFDPLSAVMTLVVSGVGALIHFYSWGYMKEDEREDKGFQRFFCYLNLFSFAMLLLVLADNLVLMFLGWEGVGLCSYLLIGFWYSDRNNAYAGSKAFIVNRIGDLGFIVGMLLLFSMLAEAGHPTVGFQDIERYFAQIADVELDLPAWLPGGPSYRAVNVVGLCFFIGACGKSAQIPLHVWLPDAMAGPTPVSALIHAATMVTAGVYLVCRMSFLYAAAPEASAIIAWTGALTAALGAVLALVQTDIKKVLAYSTMSQLGFMFVAVGCGAYAAAMFHLATHAFMQALLFLAAGSVILAMQHEQNIDAMGGLRRRIPRTHWTFLIGALALSGVLPFAGFFSKDAILVAAYGAEVAGGPWLYRLMLATAGLTALYLFRLYFRVFRGKGRAPRGLRDRMEDPPGSMVVPLYVLSGLAIFAGLAGFPQAWGDLGWVDIEESNSFANFLAPVLAGSEREGLAHEIEYRLTLRAVLAAITGTGLAWWLYLQRPTWPEKIRSSFHRLHHVLVAKFWVDEIYGVLLVRPLVAISDRLLYRGIDAGLIDGLLVNGVARSIRALAANGLRYVQSGLIQAYMFLMLVGAVAIVALLMR